jgi:hypothetical protein
VIRAHCCNGKGHLVIVEPRASCYWQVQCCRCSAAAAGLVALDALYCALVVELWRESSNCISCVVKDESSSSDCRLVNYTTTSERARASSPRLIFPQAKNSAMRRHGGTYVLITCIFVYSSFLLLLLLLVPLHPYQGLLRLLRNGELPLSCP